MNEQKDDRLWCTIFEIGAAIIGISMVVGAITQIVKRFRPQNKLLVIRMRQAASQVKDKSESKE